MDQVLGLALDKCWGIAHGQGLGQGQGVPGNNVITSGGGGGGGGGGLVVGEAAHVEGERLALQRQTLVFISHVATQQCDPALFSPHNGSRYLETIAEKE